MLLNPNDLAFLSQKAVFAAKEAGSLIRKRSGEPLSVQQKKGGDQIESQVLTEVDCLSQELLLEVLLPTCVTYDLALLTEESTDDRQRLEKDYFWCIDPLDGTLPFIESSPGYSVSIALLSRSGMPQIGVVYDPVKQTLYSAIKGEGAYRNGLPWKVNSSETRSHSLTLICDRSLIRNSKYTEIVEKFEFLAQQSNLEGVNVIHWGGAVMNACWVIEKDPACYFKFPKPQEGGGSLWDFAATACLFHELGAVACDFYGQPLDLNRPDSTFMNHRGVLFAAQQSQVDQVRLLMMQVLTPHILDEHPHLSL